jgi:hypothetical protein
MRKRKWLWRGIILVLYAITWIGGWTTHVRDLAASTQAGYRRMEERNIVSWGTGSAIICDLWGWDA